MQQLDAALRSEARLAAQMPVIIQLVIDQQKWIRDNLSHGHVPGSMEGCKCSVCENALAGRALLRRFDDLKLTDHARSL